MLLREFDEPKESQSSSDEEAMEAMVLTELREDVCLMLPNGLLLVGSLCGAVQFDWTT